MSNPPDAIPCVEETTKIGKSEIDTIQFSYKWTVDKFTSSKIEVGEKLVSPIFSPIRFHSQWRLEVAPWRPDSMSPDNIIVYLRLISDNGTEVMGTTKCSILNTKGETILSSYPCNSWYNVKCGDAFPTMIDLEGILLTNTDQDILPDDKLTILCEFVMIRGVTSSPTISQELKLINNMDQLFENRNFTDFSINVSGRALKAHKAMLALRSEYFSKKFENDETNFIDIKDIDYEVINEMLRYVYTGKVKEIEKIAERLFVAADRYGIEDLKQICSQILCEKLSIENAAEILKLSLVYNGGYFQMLAIGYVEKHRDEVIKTEGFKEFVKEYPDLAADILAALGLGPAKDGDSDSDSD